MAVKYLPKSSQIRSGHHFRKSRLTLSHAYHSGYWISLSVQSTTRSELATDCNHDVLRAFHSMGAAEHPHCNWILGLVPREYSSKGYWFPLGQQEQYKGMMPGNVAPAQTSRRDRMSGNHQYGFLLYKCWTITFGNHFLCRIGSSQILK